MVRKHNNMAEFPVFIQSAFCSGQTVCQCVGWSVNQSFRKKKKISQSVLRLVSTSRLVSVEQGSPFTELIQSSMRLTGTVPFICEASQWILDTATDRSVQLVELTTCQSVRNLINKLLTKSALSDRERQQKSQKRTTPTVTVTSFLGFFCGRGCQKSTNKSKNLDSNQS